MAKNRINYFEQVQHFDYLCMSALPKLTPGYRSVYFALLSINNSSYWSRVFDVDFDHVLRLSRVDKDTYRRSMDYFNECGLFESYEKGVNKWARAKVCLKVLTEKSVSSTVGNTVSSTGSKVGIDTPLPTVLPVEIPASTAHTIEKTDIKTKTKKTERGTPPVFDDILICFKELSVTEKWTDTFCDEKAKKFFETYKNKWPDDWKAKVKVWIVTEKNPETKNGETVSTRSWPNHYDPELDRTLSPKEHQQYGNHLITKCDHIVKKNELGKFIAFVPKITPEQNSNADIMNQLASKFANTLKK